MTGFRVKIKIWKQANSSIGNLSPDRARSKLDVDLEPRRQRITDRSRVKPIK